ncbi:MAG: FkbM family methyltransferase [Nannocystaceae bacterium]|nr:FkbM family methyltransferase [Nannocystaceae bacterium]
MDALKRRLAGTAIGSSLARGRQLWALLRTTTHPELWGMLSQDTCAEKLLVRLCRPRKTFLDIGAHIGSVFGEVRRLDRSIKIIAVEAIPDKVKTLQRRFDDVTFHCCALGEENREVPFFVNTKLSGYSSLANGSRNKESAVEIRVQLCPLDELIPDVDDIDLIKLDVEGAELGVLRGGDKVIDRSRPVVMFESGPDGGKALGFTPQAVFEWFNQRDFDVLVPNRLAHECPGLSLEGFLDSHRFPRRTLNYFAVPSERRDEVRVRAHSILA